MRSLLHGLLIALAAFAASPDVSAQSYPAKPVRLIVADAAGGAPDQLARIVAQKLSDALGQQVFVDNRPGAAGVLGADLAAHAPADGHTLLLTTTAIYAILPSLKKGLPYDVQKDFAPVITTSNQPSVLAVNAALPVKSLAELVAYAKANPGKINYASVGNGSSSHLTMELLKSAAGFDATHIPFNGSPPAVTSTIQGETQMLFAVMQPLKAQIDAGKLRAIAVTTAKRFPLLPDLPSIAESGYPAVVSDAWNGIVVPAGTPKAIIDKLNAEINAVLKMPDVVQKMQAQGFDLVGGTPEQFGALLKAEVDRWAPVIKKVGLKVD